MAERKEAVWVSALECKRILRGKGGGGVGQTQEWGLIAPCRVHCRNRFGLKALRKIEAKLPGFFGGNFGGKKDPKQLLIRFCLRHA